MGQSVVLRTAKKSKARKIGRELITRELIFLKMGSVLYIFQIFLQKNVFMVVSRLFLDFKLTKTDENCLFLVISP